ncbi:gas vesicle protein K [Promicromonospora sp. MEB111]|uniref:gas vesicle protein K n=1 Tax=unclassified Promicromonospora TaxID=2647929 RepID=UPI002550D958|nr:gas vesicle protein K [Promicromonospora sp. MEB111]
MQVDETSLKNGLLTLVVTLVEVIEEALESQAIRRLEGGELTEAEQERLGQALLDLDSAIEQIKDDHGLAASVADLRRGLDDLVGDLVDQLANPTRWVREPGREPP